MASVSLRRLIVKNKDTHEIFQQLLNLSAERIGVKDVKGEIILGVDISNPQHETAITLGEEVLGWVYGGEQSIVLAGLLSHYAIKESERKTLGQEVLTMYREINVIYDFSEKLAKTIEPEVIASLTLEEATHLINISGGVFVVKSHARRSILELLGSTGKQLIGEKELNNKKFSI